MPEARHTETRLCFDPVTCIITVISALPGPVSADAPDPPVAIYDLSGQRVALRRPASAREPAERFADVQGAVVVVGHAAMGEVPAATIFESGGTYVRGEGTARFLGHSRAGLRLRVEARSEDGRDLVLDAVCPVVVQKCART